MKIHITGANGYIGKALVKAGAIPLNCDVTNESEILDALDEQRPRFVVHLAGKSDVEWCEKRQNAVKTSSVNVLGTRLLAEKLRERVIPSVMLSSSQIWNGGTFEKNHKEDSRPTAPVNYYGVTKVAAEFLARELGMKVIRTSYLFNFQRLSEKITDLEQEKSFGEPVFIRRSFLHLDHFVEMILWYAKEPLRRPEVLHLSGTKTVSWYEFMKDVARMMGLNEKLVRPRLFEKRDYAPRPHNGGLDVSASQALGSPQYSYLDGIRRMRDEN